MYVNKLVVKLDIAIHVISEHVHPPKCNSNKNYYVAWIYNYLNNSFEIQVTW